jgi:hypothetical protein
MATDSGSKLEPGTYQSGLGRRDGHAKPRSDQLHRKTLNIAEKDDVPHDTRKALNLSAYHLGHLTSHQILFGIFR